MEIYIVVDSKTNEKRLQPTTFHNAQAYRDFLNGYGKSNRYYITKSYSKGGTNGII